MTDFSLVAELNEYKGGAMDCNVKLLKKLDDNTVMIDGVKYQKIEEPPKSKTLYEALHRLYRNCNGLQRIPGLSEICDATRGYLIDHSTIETEDADMVTFTIHKAQLQVPTLEELKQIDNSIGRYYHTEVLKDKIKDAYPIPKMNFELGGKFEIVSYNGEKYLRYQFNDRSHNWYKRKYTVDGVLMVAITDAETRRLLEGLWYNDVRKGEKYD